LSAHISVVQQISASPRRATIVHGRIPGDLLHPKLVPANGDPGDIHSVAPEMDEQHVAADASDQSIVVTGQ
jgi:hypothetical protein